MKISEALFSILVVMLSLSIFAYALVVSKKAESRIGKAFETSSDIIATDRKIRNIIGDFEHLYFVPKKKEVKAIEKIIRESVRKSIQIVSVSYDDSKSAVIAEWKRNGKVFRTQKKF